MYLNKTFLLCRCCSCDKSLDGVEFLVESEAAYCADCYNMSKGLVCHRCGKGIVAGSTKKTTIITCESNNYHQECYLCLVFTLVPFNYPLHPSEMWKEFSWSACFHGFIGQGCYLWRLSQVVRLYIFILIMIINIT